MNLQLIAKIEEATLRTAYLKKKKNGRPSLSSQLSFVICLNLS